MVIRILLVAPMASGKSSAAEVLNRLTLSNFLTYSKIFSTSVKVTKWAEEMGFPNPPRSIKQLIGSFVDGLRKNNDGIVYALQADIEKGGCFSVAIVDSVRTEEQMRRWKKMGGYNHFVYLEVSDQQRWERNNHRLSKKGLKPISKAKFMKEHEHSLDHDIGRLRSWCNHVVNTGGTMEETRLQLIKLLEVVLKLKSV